MFEVHLSGGSYAATPPPVPTFHQIANLSKIATFVGISEILYKMLKVQNIHK